MEIYITYRLKANSGKNALVVGRDEVTKAISCINSVLEGMKAQLKEKYPKYPLRTNCLDIEAELWDEEIWQVFTTMQLYLENKFCESGEYNEYDVWDSKGCPMYEDVQEPLFTLDWKEIKENFNTKAQSRMAQSVARRDLGASAPCDLGLFYDFQFDSVKAVESYSGEGVHFYNNQEWL